MQIPRLKLNRLAILLVAIAVVSMSLLACSETGSNTPGPTSVQANGAVTAVPPPAASIASRTPPALSTPSPTPTEPRRGLPQAYYLTSTTPGFDSGTLPSFDATASPATLTLTANGAPGNFAVNARTGNPYYSFSIAQANSGSANCPAGDVALNETIGTLRDPVEVAAYAPGQCVLSIEVDGVTLQLVVNVPRSLGSPSPAGHIAGVFAAASGGLFVQSWAAANPTEQSILFSTSACGDGATATGLARNGAGEWYIAIASSDLARSCSVIDKFAAGAGGSAAPIASVTLPTGAGSGGIAIDHSGNVYIALPGSSAVAEYSSDLASQLAVLTGSNTGLNSPVSVAFDSAGNLYVSSFPPGPPNGPLGNISEFAPLAPGSNNIAPMRTIETVGDDGCGLQNNPDLLIDASGNIFSAMVLGGGIIEYPPEGSSSPMAFGGPNPDGFTIDGDRFYESYSSHYGCAQGPTEPTSLVYFDLPNHTLEVPFVTSTSGLSPQLVTY